MNPLYSNFRTAVLAVVMTLTFLYVLPLVGMIESSVLKFVAFTIFALIFATIGAWNFRFRQKSQDGEPGPSQPQEESRFNWSGLKDLSQSTIQWLWALAAGVGVASLVYVVMSVVMSASFSLPSEIKGFGDLLANPMILVAEGVKGVAALVVVYAAFRLWVKATRPEAKPIYRRTVGLIRLAAVLVALSILGFEAVNSKANFSQDDKARKESATILMARSASDVLEAGRASTAWWLHQLSQRMSSDVGLRQIITIPEVKEDEDELKVLTYKKPVVIEGNYELVEPEYVVAGSQWIVLHEETYPGASAKMTYKTIVDRFDENNVRIIRQDFLDEVINYRSPKKKVEEKVEGDSKSTTNQLAKDDASSSTMSLQAAQTLFDTMVDVVYLDTNGWAEAKIYPDRMDGVSFRAADGSLLPESILEKVAVRMGDNAPGTIAARYPKGNTARDDLVYGHATVSGENQIMVSPITGEPTKMCLKLKLIKPVAQGGLSVMVVREKPLG